MTAVEPLQDQEASPTALYRWYDADGHLLYIGITGNLLDRTSQHNSDSSWMEFAARAAVERYPSRPEALAAEEAAIKKEHPLFNSQHNQ